MELSTSMRVFNVGEGGVLKIVRQEHYYWPMVTSSLASQINCPVKLRKGRLVKHVNLRVHFSQDSAQMGVLQAVSCERGCGKLESISSPAMEATEAFQKSVDSMDS